MTARFSAHLIAVAALVGCALGTAPASPASSAQIAQTAPHTPARGPGRSMENDAYLLLQDGSIHEGAAPSGLHVLGSVDNGQFFPRGDVLGEGLLGDAGQPGWLELRDGNFHGDQTARPPFPPYVRGYRTADGGFRPSSRTVHY